MYPVVRRTLEVMDQLGVIQLPLKVNGLQVKIQPIGEIAMASNMTKVNQVMQYAQIASSLGPTGQMTIKVEQIADYIADAMGIRTDIRTTYEENADATSYGGASSDDGSTATGSTSTTTTGRIMERNKRTLMSNQYNFSKYANLPWMKRALDPNTPMTKARESIRTMSREYKGKENYFLQFEWRTEL